MQEFPHGDQKGKFSMLGLGDIVLPGLFLALLLRFDACLAHKASNIGKMNLYHFRKPFFMTAVVAYSIGLGVVIWMMHYMDRAQVAYLAVPERFSFCNVFLFYLQPALVILVPFCLMASVLTALWEGKMPELLAYTEEVEEEPKIEQEVEKKEK